MMYKMRIDHHQLKIISIMFINREKMNIVRESLSIISVIIKPLKPSLNVESIFVVKYSKKYDLQ